MASGGSVSTWVSSSVPPPVASSSMTSAIQRGPYSAASSTRRCAAGVRLWWTARAKVAFPAPGSPSSTSHSGVRKARSTAWRHFAHSGPDPTAAGSAGGSVERELVTAVWPIT